MKASELRKFMLAFFGAGAITAGGYGHIATAGDDTSSNLLSDIDSSLDDELSTGVGETNNGNIVIKKGKFGNVEITAPNAEISEMLQYLSSHFNVNIISTRNVTGRVNVNIRDLNMKDALTAILDPNGWTFIEKGKFVYVYTKEELKEIEEANRKMVTKVIHLNYLNSTDAQNFVKSESSKLGSIVANAEAAKGFVPSESDGGANSFAMGDILVVRDYEENVEAISKLIMLLDTAPVQVLVEVTVLRVALTEANAFGVDMSVLFDIDFDGITAPLDPIADLVSGTIKSDGIASQTGFGQISKSGGAKVGILTKNVAAFIRAVDEVNDTTVVAHPKILTLNRMPSNLLVGSKLGYQSTTTSSTNTTQDVKFIETGVKLNVRPFVSNDGHIRMELKPSLSDGTTRDTAAGTIPDTIVQEMTTNVILRNGQTIVLGGLFQENIVTDRKQVPGLGDVPVLGNAFKGQDDSIKRSEIIFIVKATIVKDKAMKSSVNQALESIRLRRLGAREGLLPWSREKMSSSHLRNAYIASDKGQTKRAQWHVDMALNINPVYVEARRMKEKLGGHKGLMPNNSILLEAVDGILNDRIERINSLKKASIQTNEKITLIAPKNVVVKIAADKTNRVKSSELTKSDAIVEVEISEETKQELVLAEKLKLAKLASAKSAKASGTKQSFGPAVVEKSLVEKVVKDISVENNAGAEQAKVEDEDEEDVLGSDR